MGPEALEEVLMSERPTVIKKTHGEVLEKVQRLLLRTPYYSVGELRRAVFDGSEMCCASCYDYTHPHAEAWEEMQGWLYLADIDWRTAE